MKGFVQTLEAVIATTLVLIFLTLAIPSITTAEQLERIGYNCLKNLDNQGLLRYNAFNNIVGLKSDLENCLPKLTDFELKICEQTLCQPEEIPLKTVVLTNYLIAGDNEPKPAIINLWMWLE